MVDIEFSARKLSREIYDRAESGAHWLDECAPEDKIIWYRAVDCIKLDMEFQGTCIIGQIFDNYIQTFREIGEDMSEFGFIAPSDLTDYEVDDYNLELCCAWMKIINKRIENHL